MNDRVDNPYGQLPAAPNPQGGALALAEQQRAVAETIASMQIARANPRNPIVAMNNILQDCTMKTLAEDATYEYARGGTSIVGPSIRLAEAIARRWGNLRTGVLELARREGFSEVKAYAMDLETGFIDEKVFQVRHIRDTKQGAKELRDERDIYETLANVAARRKRACILAIIPTDVVEAAVKQCEITMSAKLEINDDYIKTVLDSFAQVGVTKEMLEKRIQRKIEALTPALAMQLRKIRTSIKDEMSAPGDWFDMGAPATGAATPPEKQGATANVANDLKARREKKAADKPAEAAKPPANAPVDPGTGEILTPESLKTELMGCTTQAQTQAVLDKIMKLPATPERAALMTEWNAAVMRVQAATPAPAAAPAPTQAPAAAPQPAQPAAQVPGEKPDGDAAEFEKAMRAMADAKDKDALDLAADRAVSFKWPEELRAQLNKRYNEQLDKFEGG